jgi:hypothetical protein
VAEVVAQFGGAGMSQLRKLAEPIPARYVGANDKGMDAADHTVITQLLHLHAPGWSFEITEVLRSQVPEKTTKNNVYPGGLFVTGCVGRLTCELDGRVVAIEEAGGVELAGMKDGDGERLKHATSDALKRCAMRLGLGLHIWAQGSYFLDRSLDRRQGSPVVAEGDGKPPAPATGGTTGGQP